MSISKRNKRNETNETREQGVVRVAKANGLTFTTVRVSKLVEDDRGALDPLPLITPKNTPRADGKSSPLPEASRSVVANTLFRASYQVI